jgi:hypothetical protein
LLIRVGVEDYPALNAGQLWPEDWLSKVIAALMCIRAYGLKHNLTVSKFSLDESASTGFDVIVTVGNPPTTLM